MQIEWDNTGSISWKIVTIIVSFFLMFFGIMAVKFNSENKIIEKCNISEIIDTKPRGSI